jgi:histidyl-tRNA synthetase
METKFDFLTQFFADTEIGRLGLKEIEILIDYLKALDLKNKFEFDIKLARGLNYYTGTIIEVKALDVTMGSICGGGRYDDLTGIFGLSGMSGVGISFGADRIYDVMLELNIFPSEIGAATKVLFINFGGEEERFCLKLTSEIRSSGISVELFPNPAKVKKQMEYAHRNNIPYVVLAGQDEMQSGEISMKEMSTGNQTKMRVDELKKLLS